MSRSKIASIPYASMSAKIGRGSTGIILLGQIDGSRLYWYAGKKGLFVTEGGRVVETAGLPANLRRTAYLDKDPLTQIINGKNKGKVGDFRRIVDMSPPDNYGVVIVSELAADGIETIEISGLTFETAVFVETCKAPEIEWSFENKYWIGREDGIIWRSIQHLHPNVPSIRLQVLKPYVG